jgi:hypothetical protein
MANWFQLITAALGGGVIVKALDIAYQEIRSRGQKKDKVAKLVEANLDPILKAADEIVGKVRALAEADFKSLQSLRANIDDIEIVGTDEANLLYLIGRFWARVEILRRQAIAVDLHSDQKGSTLNQFFACLESRRVRLVDRGVQRAIGETLIEESAPEKTRFFIEFADKLENEHSVRRWFRPLYLILTRTAHTAERQRILQYAAVLHAMIDVLDPGHRVTGDRPGWSNKLTLKSRRGLRHRVFGVYLKFVQDPKKYSGFH